MPIYSIRISNKNTASEEFLTKSLLNHDAASRLAQELAIDLERQDPGVQYTVTILDIANRPVARIHAGDGVEEMTLASAAQTPRMNGNRGGR